MSSDTKIFFTGAFQPNIIEKGEVVVSKKSKLKIGKFIRCETVR
jgi:hypothetical protein